MTDIMAKIDYLEFRSNHLSECKQFFEKVFGWKFTDYGENYTAFYKKEAGIDGGIHSSEKYLSTENGSVIAVFYTKNLEETQKQIGLFGGTITIPTFNFPGGKRFHFTEPTGNEFAVWTEQ